MTTITVDLTELPYTVDAGTGTFTTARHAVSVAIKHHEDALKGIARRQGKTRATDYAVARHTDALTHLHELRDLLTNARTAQRVRDSTEDPSSPLFVPSSMRIMRHDGCDACEDSRVPGVLHGPLKPVGPSGTVMIHDIQACDNCGRFEGDLDAAFALSKVDGGRVFFYQSDGVDDDPEEDNETREFADVADDTACIATGTNPWIRIDPPGPTGQEGRV